MWENNSLTQPMALTSSEVQKHPLYQDLEVSIVYVILKYLVKKRGAI